MLFIRSILFYFSLWVNSLMFGVFCIIAWVFPFRTRFWLLMLFNRWALFCLRIICGVRCEIKGAENLPKDQPYVVMSKHQSTFETFYLQWYLGPISTILKRELLRIPFFGWGLAMLRPIPINRDNPRSALKKVKVSGSRRIADGMNVLIFPEGTRMPLGESGTYARSGAEIAINSNAPLIPIAHNSAKCWPMGTLYKYSGTITISIGPAIETEGRTSKAITQDVKDWIENEVKVIGH